MSSDPKTEPLDRRRFLGAAGLAGAGLAASALPLRAQDPSTSQQLPEVKDWNRNVGE